MPHLKYSRRLLGEELGCHPCKIEVSNTSGSALSSEGDTSNINKLRNKMCLISSVVYIGVNTSNRGVVSGSNPERAALGRFCTFIVFI